MIERWHTFAEQSVESIAAQYNDKNIELLTQIVRDGLNESGPLQFDSPGEFAQYVVDIRTNERAWSRRLGNTILRAQDQLASGKTVEARETLSGFSATCPWDFFSEIARTQLENISG